jgi:hypothetical protein
MRILYLLCLSFIVTITATAQSSNLTGRETNARIIRFYPNPAISQINFDFVKGYEANYTFQVYSFLGKKVVDIPNVSSKTTINLSDYTRGIYIFQLRDRNGKVLESGKFQVSK